MLQNPDLVAEINDGQYWAEGLAASRVPVVALFPTGNMRVEATQAVHSLERALPVWRDFMGTPLYVTKVSLWYGFIVGGRGGGAYAPVDGRPKHVRSPNRCGPVVAL